MAYMECLGLGQTIKSTAFHSRNGVKTVRAAGFPARAQQAVAPDR